MFPSFVSGETKVIKPRGLLDNLAYVPRVAYVPERSEQGAAETSLPLASRTMSEGKFIEFTRRTGSMKASLPKPPKPVTHRGSLRPINVRHTVPFFHLPSYFFHFPLPFFFFFFLLCVIERSLIKGRRIPPVGNI